MLTLVCCISCFFFFNDTATTEIYTLSLHDALPICSGGSGATGGNSSFYGGTTAYGDRKSTRLNSSHANISYAVFCLKKKNIDIFYNLTFHNACLRLMSNLLLLHN